MGLFSSLFGGERSRVRHLGDRVWISHAAKMAAIRRDVEDRARDGAAAILLVGHFEETCSELAAIIDPLANDFPLTVVRVADLESRLGEQLRLDESVQIDFIVAERHFLDSEDDRLIQFAEQLPCTSRIGQHVSLDDPLLEIFVGDTVRSMLEAIGLKDNESIDSPIVTRRIKATQKKLAARATSNTPAPSAAAWISANLETTTQ